MAERTTAEAARQVDAIVAANMFRDGIAPRADAHTRESYPLWHGWAIVEAFLAGAKWMEEHK